MPTTRQPYQGLAQEMTYPEYVLIDSLPADWTKYYDEQGDYGYNHYYRKSGNSYVRITDEAAPDFNSEDFYVEFASQPDYTNPELHRFVESDVVPYNQDLQFLISGTDSYRYVGIDAYHVLTTAKPTDWEANYTDYLYKDGEQYKYVSGISAPPWEPNKYYSADCYILTTVSPLDWETNYTSYFEKVNDEYVHVSGTSAPTWEPDKYYSRKEIP